MLIPVRCFTCGKVISNLYLDFKEKLTEGKTPSDAMDELGMDRYCCRRMFTSHVSGTVDDVIRHGKF